jgi:putative membrane protein
MKTCLRWSTALLLATAFTVSAADVAAPVSTHARTVGEALLYMLVFAVAGIVIAILGYKLFDKFTPGDLHKEIVEKQNVAAALVAAAVVLGICIIIAAAMIG